MDLKRGVFQVLLANIVTLIFAVGNNFILPKYLSLEAYADYKTLVLYTIYIGILHFGYVDGIYIKYGGKDECEVSKEAFGYAEKCMLIFQFILTCIGVVVTLWIRDIILFCAVLCIIPMNMISLHKMFYQATGSFKKYRQITNVSNGLIFLLNMVLLFVWKKESGIWFVISQLVVNLLVWLYYELQSGTLWQKSYINFAGFISQMRENIGLGFIVMLGSFMAVGITGMDRWFVKALCTATDFAYYSFAASVLRLINIVSTAFSVTLYHYFCKEDLSKKVESLRRSILIIGAAMLTIVYPIEIFVHIFLEKYNLSIPIMFLIFTAQYVMLMVNAVYLNIYKALNKQKKFLMSMIFTMVVAIATNFFMYFVVTQSMWIFAAATLITAVFWLLLCQRMLSDYRMKGKEWLYLLLVILLFLLSGSWHPVMALTIYLMWILLWANILFHEEMRELFQMGKESLRGIL